MSSPPPPLQNDPVRAPLNLPVTVPLTLETLFERTVILGASVSADWIGESPGKKLARRIRPDGKIDLFAYPGLTSEMILNRIDEKRLTSCTVVIALDLFFWDSLADDAAGGLEALVRLCTQCNEKNIPIIFGDIPALFPSLQPSLEALNRAIWSTENANPLCAVASIASLFSQIQRNGGIEFEGRFLNLGCLMPDRLHLSDDATSILETFVLGAAQQIVRRANQKRP